MTQPAGVAPDEVAEASRGKTLAVLVLIFVISLPLGYLVLTIMDTLLDAIWLDAAGELTGIALVALVLVVPTLAGVLVALCRRYGNDGHNPMFGIALNPITTRDYPSIIGAIAATLIGGLVLGPEVAMVSTGAWVGTVLSARTGIKQKAGVGIGALAAILALFVGPLLHGSFETAAKYTFTWPDLIGAVGVGAATAGLIALGRFVSIGFLKLRGGDKPRVEIMALAGLLVGISALAYHYISGYEVGLVLTSGETNILEMLKLGSAGAIALTIGFKLLAYSLSMGGGFRGGPFFPAMYIGAGVGAVAGLATPDFAGGATAAGLTAAVIYLSHPKWIFVVLLGVVLGLLAGGPDLIPIAVLAGLVAKALPGVKVSTAPTGAETVTEVR